MANWKTSMYAQLVYMIGMGLPFLLAPNFMLPMLGLERTDEIWIRILGMLVMAISLYYFYAIQEGNTAFARVSVRGRLLFCVGLTALALIYHQYIFVFFAILEAGLAVWTQRTLPSPA